MECLYGLGLAELRTFVAGLITPATYMYAKPDGIGQGDMQALLIACLTISLIYIYVCCQNKYQQEY